MAAPITRRRILLDNNNPWLQGGSWSLGSSGWTNSPALGADLITNGAFAADTNWTKGTGWSISSGAGVHAAGAGAGNITQAVLTVGNWYQAVWSLTVAANNFNAWFGAGNPNRSTNGTYTDTGRAVATTAGVRATATAADGSVDNVSFKLIPSAQMFIAKRGLASVSAGATLTTGCCSGVVAMLNSVDAPTDFLIGFHDGVNIKLEKCVAGTYTSLISTTAAYSAGATIEIRRTGATTFQLWYNGSQVGTDQTVSDASILSGLLWGGFSTYSGNVLANLAVS